MPARAISSGTISFGLVSIPIKVYTANQSKTVHFSMLHEKDKSRLKQQYVCATCGEVVSRDEIVKGYEFARDQYVVLNEEELKALEQKSDRTIEIEEFVPIEKVDPLYFEKSNLLGPDKGGAKAYHLLREAMEDSGRIAIGRFANRGRHQLVLIRPTARGLIMHGLFYADEVRSFEDVDLGDKVTLKAGELNLAKQLIDQLAHETFDPKRYEDDYRRSVVAVIERKAAGEEIVAAPPEREREQIIDLVAALKKSLAQKRGEGAVAARKPARAKGAKTGKRKSAAD